MAKKRRKANRSAYLKALFFGILSIALYTLVFSNEEVVREIWARGGAYTALPIATVFVFSFVHGSFANYLMTSLGIVAKKSS